MALHSWIVLTNGKKGRTEEGRAGGRAGGRERGREGGKKRGKPFNTSSRLNLATCS